MKTYATKQKDVLRKYYLIDAKDMILGKVAAKAAHILKGKHQVTYVPYLDTGDYVVVVNAVHVAVTGQKEEQKKYYSYSGYPHGLKVRSLREVKEKDPNSIITKAVRGMLPKTRLGREMLKKLFVFSESEHNLKNKEFITTSI